MIVDAVDKLPTDPGVRERGEVFLLDQATRLNATDLAKAARHLVEVADPDQAERNAERDLERQARAAHHRYLSIIEDGAGGIRHRGRGTVEDAAAIKAALLPITHRYTGDPSPAVSQPPNASGKRWPTHRHTSDPSPAVSQPPNASGKRWPTHRHTSDPSPAVSQPPNASGKRWPTHRHTSDPSPAVSQPPNASGKRWPTHRHTSDPSPAARPS